MSIVLEQRQERSNRYFTSDMLIRLRMECCPGYCIILSSVSVKTVLQCLATLALQYKLSAMMTH